MCSIERLFELPRCQWSPLDMDRHRPAPFPGGLQMSTMTLTPSIPSFRTSQVRLTRRGRLVVFVAALLFVLACAVFLGTSSVASNNESSSAQQTEVIMVGCGETLWGISSDLAEAGSVRDIDRNSTRLNSSH